MLSLEQIEITNGAFKLSADLQIKPGTITAIIGPSGAGKSTLIEALCGFLPVTRGRILWNETNLTRMAPAARPIAMLFQDHNLFPHLDVSQNVGLGLRPDLRLNAAQNGQITQALGRVGLQDLGTRKPAALSGGQQSRAALARVLVQNRPLIGLDEPFAALGPALRNDMLDLVAALARETGRTVLMVSHNPQDAARIADQVIVVAEGRAEQPAPTEEVLNNPPPALRAYLGPN